MTQPYRPSLTYRPSPTLAAIVLVLALTILTSHADAAYPGKSGAIAYNKYKDVGEMGGATGQIHPEGGLLVHGPHSREEPSQLTSEPSDTEPAYSPNGRLIAFSSDRGQTGLERTDQLYLMRSDGSAVRQLTDDPAGAWSPYFSPDGRKLVFVRSGQLWLLTIATGAERQLTFGRGGHNEPVFTPSGRRILFASDRAQDGGKYDTSDIWAVGSDGRNPKVLVNGAGAEMSPEVSPNGKRIAYVVPQSSMSGYGSLRIARANGRFVRSLDQEPGPECKPCYGNPTWAPDGKHLMVVERSGTVGGSSALVVMRPDGTHLKSFDAGRVETEGYGTHVESPAWGSAER